MPEQFDAFGAPDASGGEPAFDGGQKFAGFRERIQVSLPVGQAQSHHPTTGRGRIGTKGANEVVQIRLVQRPARSPGDQVTEDDG